MVNIKIITRALGLFLFVEGLAMALALVTAYIYKETAASAFITSILTCFVAGAVMILFSRKASRKIGKREGFTIVTLTWVIFSVFGSLPFLLSKSIPDFTDAFFETISGFTTTGSSILNHIEEMPHSILLWRSLTQWLGGMGIIVLSLAILPVFGIGGMQLYSAEVPGPTPDKISPKIKQTAKTLWAIYLLFTGAETLLLWAGGMSFFDAINHSFTTMATGGFSTKQASIAHWDSPFIQYVIIFFMFLAGTNFSLSYCMLKGKFKRVFHDEEFKYYILFITGFTLMIFTGLIFSTASGAEKAFRDSLFQVVSIITTTGYVTTDYLLWKPAIIVLLFALFFFGGSAGSTGGGLKIMRVVILLKNSYYELRRMVHPQAVIPVRFNNHTVEQKIVNNVLAFFIIYFLTFVVSVIIFTIFEPNLDTAMGAVATSLGNIGPGLGNVGPVETFSHIHPAGKWFLSLLMLLGRLEFFTVLVLLSPSFWKK